MCRLLLLQLLSSSVQQREVMPGNLGGRNCVACKIDTYTSPDSRKAIYGCQSAYKLYYTVCTCESQYDIFDGLYFMMLLFVGDPKLQV